MDAAKAQILKHCVVHTAISVTPTFVMAVIFGFETLPKILAMICGILVFLSAAVFLHFKLDLWLKTGASVFAKAIKFTKIIRMAYALIEIGVLIALPLLSVSMLDTNRLWANQLQRVLFLDFLSGILANNWIDRFVMPIGIDGRAVPYGYFLPTFLATILDGVLLSLLMLGVALVLWVGMRLGMAVKGPRRVKV